MPGSVASGPTPLFSAAAAAGDCFAADRLLVRRPPFPVEPVELFVRTVGQAYADVSCSGIVGCDGTISNGRFVCLARGAWAFSFWSADSNCWVSAFGPLPGMVHTILRAELFGFLQVLLRALPPLVVVVDNDTIIKGLQHGRLWCTASERPAADLWRRSWDIIDEIGVPLVFSEPVGAPASIADAAPLLAVVKFASHSPQDSVSTDLLPFFYASKQCDHHAKRIGREIAVSDELSAPFFHFYGEVTSAARYAAAHLAALPRIRPIWLQEASQVAPPRVGCSSAQVSRCRPSGGGCLPGVQPLH